MVERTLVYVEAKKLDIHPAEVGRMSLKLLDW